MAAKPATAKALRPLATNLATALRSSWLTNLRVGHQPELQRASLFDAAPAELKREVFDKVVVEAAARPDLDRALGALVGMAVADSLGHNFEFLAARNTPHTNFLEYPAKDGTPGGRVVGRYNQFNLRPGQWTDDASMGLCLADALLIRGGSYDGVTVRTWFYNWWFNGLDNAFRLDDERERGFFQGSLSVGLGGNIAQSLREIENCAAQGIPVPARFGATNSDAGNGSLMRLAAVPLLYHNDVAQARAVAYESSLTTHPGPMAAEACSFLAHAICKAIHRGPGTASVDAKMFLDGVVAEYLAEVLGQSPNEDHDDGNGSWDEGKEAVRRLLLSSEPPEGKEAVWNWRDPELAIEQTLVARGGRYNGYPVSAGYFGAFSIDGLAIALHCVYNTDSFNAAVVKCINFCGDADTTGAICAQLAGALYGYTSVDSQWVKDMQQWAEGEVELRAALLFLHGEEPLLQSSVKTLAQSASSEKDASATPTGSTMCDVV